MEGSAFDSGNASTSPDSVEGDADDDGNICSLPVLDARDERLQLENDFA